MPYHPALESLLDTPEIRRIKKLDLRDQRKIFADLSIAQIKRLPRPDIIEEDIKLENDTILRHYKPKKASDKAVLFIHGGGWCLSSIDTYDHVCRYLCDQGNLNIFSLEYGLGPEDKYPAAVDHALYAYDWLYENITKFNLSTENIFVMGDSAGGNLVTIICHERQENMPKAQILVYPAVDMYTKYDSNTKFDEYKYHLTTEWCELFLKAYIGEDIMSEPKKLRQPTISPLFYKDTKQPDTLIVAATHDILIDGIYAYEEKLKQQGTYVETHYDDEMYHGFIGGLGVVPFENPKIALDKIIEFINKR
ncbi:pimeloyl-ACP methyl ester esterase BioJ [Francisella philomiragia]|uniref:pimeloyl-ACP methyl ester esterase BioJ n=1 Tax=Francisella philomiragia TaxID=28110 RepID=UPI0019056102|nr:pimeloyl-ACP methyl ester esterase BioJ [Francisella philomiragia]MBK2266541.1 pimeloyl-ACP methyl ester esterase BioJ [Francisella philomiragia]MBK2278291.1 pimeloyl-ACP methyl ester esterase BioJ [Francisella philomiragia]MBK2286147.1 pimeloyl-ACP methyl ester esterase BioJ [Francisella philomiragia]MBK2287824.1 pimeloyl-ACP methyl ester esterase BioJ [Francisella philomiragia]MBK2290106.1 pimeloyl-ACP methyl ester esterase BioJ [Francisella philomiragia]